MTIAYQSGLVTVYHGDCLAVLGGLPAESVHCCVTSPPYWGLRDYGVAGQLGLEPTPGEYVERMVAVFDEVRRVLRHDGTLWLNVGDSYANDAASEGDQGPRLEGRANVKTPGKRWRGGGLKKKDLVGVPWMLAFALRDAGWYLRQDIIWHKPAPMPESVTDRCTKAHEYLFLFTKSAAYYYDAEAIKEKSRYPAGHTVSVGEYATARAAARGESPHGNEIPGSTVTLNGLRNRRSVWTVASQPYADAHFATFQPKLIEPCILAGTSEEGCCGDCGAPRVRQTIRTKVRRERPNDLTKRTGEDGTGNHCPNGVAGVAVATTGWAPSCECDAATVPCVVLDPFLGSGTTAAVAVKWGRRAVGVDLNADYIRLAEKRIGAAADALGMFANLSEAPN